MPPSVFQQQSALGLADLCDELGCQLADLESERLIVVPRPPDPRHQHYLALVASAGVGTVASVAPEMMEWAGNHRPERHFLALRHPFLEGFVAEARSRGWPEATAWSLGLGFALAEVRPVPPTPAGLTLRRVDASWMASYRDARIFENAVAEPGEEHIARIRHGFALFDAGDQPVAVAGIWEQGNRRDEIGVDVVRAHRGEGLAKVVVLSAVHDILGRGRAPFYSISETNVRSHRNALACGFLPLFNWSVVEEKESP